MSMDEYFEELTWKKHERTAKQHLDHEKDIELARILALAYFLPDLTICKKLNCTREAYYNVVREIRQQEVDVICKHLYEKEEFGDTEPDFIKNYYEARKTEFLQKLTDWAKKYQVTSFDLLANE